MTQQQEINLIEGFDGGLTAYELKWNKKEGVRFSQTFTDNYPNSKTSIITPDNIEDFLLQG